MNNLHKIKKTGFKVPQDYFVNLEDHFLSEIKLKNSVKTNGFKAPNNYFETVDLKISNATKKHKETKVITLLSWKKIGYTTAVAASIALMINIYFTKPEPITLNSIKTANLENYIINEDFETNEMASLFTDEELSDVKLINDGVNSETLESYLFNNVDIDDLDLK